jgi:hypothetical protein
MRAAVQSAFGRRPRRNSIFARIIEALHVSRRIEARRLLRRYRHLNAEDFQGQSNSISPASTHATESTENADRNNARVRADHREFQNA